MTPLLIAATLLFVLTLAHAAVLNAWRAAINRASHPLAPEPAIGGPLITVIVPARNAEATLAPLLQDLHAQRWPRDRCEVLVMDDHSEDGTAAVVNVMMPRWPQLRIIPLEEDMGKKAAITAGVNEAKGELVLITDADARCGSDRLHALVSHWRATGSDMILMPVHVTGRGLLAGLQEEEQCAFMAAAAGSAIEGSPLLANGANMAFTPDAYKHVGGYSGDRRASGDDQFLLARMKKAGKRISCLLDPAAMVAVAAETSWSAFFSQRLRWSGKMRAAAGRSSFIGAFAVLLPYLIAAITTWAVLRFRFGQGMERTWLLIFFSWTLWIFPIIALVNAGKRALNVRPRSLRTLLALLCFPLYALPVALLSFFIKPRWKGRRV